jgi:hypothetical protein
VQTTAIPIQSAQHAQIQLQSLSETPGQACLKDLAKRSDVNWQNVAVVNQAWDESHSGLSAGGAALLSIAVAAAMPGAGALMSGATGTAASAGATALNAGLSALSSQAAVAFANNGGDLGKTLNDLGQSANVKTLLSNMATAGALDAWGAPASYSGQIGEASQSIMRLDTQLMSNLKTQLTSTLMSSAIEGKTLSTDALGDAFKTAFINTGLAKGAKGIGDAKQVNALNDFTQALSHSVLGCMGGAAMQGGGCSAGALGGVVGELTAKYGVEQGGLSEASALKLAKIVSAASGLLIDPNSAAGVNIANTTGTNAAVNNRLAHDSEKASIKALAQGKPQQEARLTAAACALVHCADGVPTTDPSYPALKKLQDAGASMMAEQTLLKQQKGWNGRTYGPLFQYSWLDQWVADPLRQNKDAIADSAALLSRQAGVVAAVATSVTVNAPPNLKPIGASVVAGATAISIGADAFEQWLRPNISQVLKEQLILGVPSEVLMRKIPTVAPIINEIKEQLK